MRPSAASASGVQSMNSTILGVNPPTNLVFGTDFNLKNKHVDVQDLDDNTKLFEQSEMDNQEPVQAKISPDKRLQTSTFNQMDMNVIVFQENTRFQPLSDFEQIHVPWQYSSNDQSNGLEFAAEYQTYDSISCIAIEMLYQQYLKGSDKDKAKMARFRHGSIIDFSTFIESKGDQQLRVRRVDRSVLKETTDEEDINRPISSTKYTNSLNFLASDASTGTLTEQPHTWIVKNYIASYGFKITKKNLSQGLMKEILLHEESSMLQEILAKNDSAKIDGSILKDEDNMEALRNRLNAWKLIFSLGGLGDNFDQYDEEIQATLFHNSEHKLSQLLIQLHTMETFLPDHIMQVQMSQDKTKLQNLGPYCLGLRSLIFGASEYRQDESIVPPFTVYRSLLITQKQFNTLQLMDGIKIFGFASASLAQSHALSQLQISAFERKMRNEAPKDDQPTVKVMLHLNIADKEDYFVVNKAAFSPYYQTEEEVILQDGMQFQFDPKQTRSRSSSPHSGPQKKQSEIHNLYFKQS